MHISNIGARKCDARLIRRRKHIATRTHVVAMLIGLEQIVVDELNRLARHLARVGRGATADKSLDGMRQSIHTRLPRNGRRQPTRKLGVVHRKARNEHKVIDGVLIVRLVVGNHRRERDFASRTGGSGNRDKQRQETVNTQQAAHLVDGFVWLRNARAHALGAVHGRTATKADNGLAVVLAIQRRRFLHIRDRGVRTRFGIDRNANPLGRERALERRRKPQTSNARIRHDKDLLYRALLEHRGHILGMLQNARLGIGQNRQCDAKNRLICSAPGTTG